MLSTPRTSRSNLLQRPALDTVSSTPYAEPLLMPNAFREHLMFAFRKVLRPLMRILIRAGVRYEEFVELVGGVYVEAAALDGLGAPHGKPPSRARISIATGVPRREVDHVFDNDGALPFLE